MFIKWNTSNYWVVPCLLSVFVRLGHLWHAEGNPYLQRANIHAKHITNCNKIPWSNILDVLLSIHINNALWRWEPYPKVWHFRRTISHYRRLITVISSELRVNTAIQHPYLNIIATSVLGIDSRQIWQDTIFSSICPIFTDQKHINIDCSHLANVSVVCRLETNIIHQLHGRSIRLSGMYWCNIVTSQGGFIT